MQDFKGGRACARVLGHVRVGVCVPTLTRDLFHCFSADPEHSSGRGREGGGVHNVMPESAAAALTNGQTDWGGCDVCCVSVLLVHVIGAARLNGTEAGGGEKVTSVHLQPPPFKALCCE